MRWIVMLGGLLCCGPAQADIFVASTETDPALRTAVAQERSGAYYRSSSLVWHESSRKVSSMGRLGTGSLTKDAPLDDVSRSFKQFVEDSFRNEPSLDMYKGVRNNLLLLEYSSPALADVVKHYRSVAAQRMTLEYARLAEMRRSSETEVDRMVRAAERACLLKNQGLGVVKAMEACLMKGDPLEGTPRPGGGEIDDGRTALHVVRESVDALGLDEKKAGADVALLGGDVVVQDNNVDALLPGVSFDQRTESFRKKYEEAWRRVLEKSSAGDELPPAALALVSLPGVPVTDKVVRDVELLRKERREVVLLTLASVLAKAEAQRDYETALVYLERAQRRPGIPEAFKNILRERMAYLTGVLEANDRGKVVGMYKDLLAEALSAAGDRREELLAR